MLTDFALSRRSLVTRAGILATMTAAVTLVPEPAVAGDEALLTLGKQFDEAWGEEIALYDKWNGRTDDLGDAAFDAAFAKTNAVVEQIEASIATTLPGLVVKARVCSWCHSGETYSAQSLGAATDDRFAALIVRDLLAIDGRTILPY